MIVLLPWHGHGVVVSAVAAEAQAELVGIMSPYIWLHI